MMRKHTASYSILSCDSAISFLTNARGLSCVHVQVHTYYSHHPSCSVVETLTGVRIIHGVELQAL